MAVTRRQRDRLALVHLHLVHDAVGRAKGRLPAHVTHDDLTQAGCLGLLDAAARYDPSRGVPFVPWARMRVHAAIMDHCRARDITGRGGRAVRSQGQLHEVLWQFGHPPPWSREAATDAPWHADEIAAGQPHERDTIGLRWLARALTVLPVRLRLVLSWHYFGGLTLRETGEVMRISESQAGQLTRDALEMLRAEAVKGELT